MTTAIELLELISSRQSDRGYLDRPVEQEKLERILEAGRLAPSACNSQPWRFIVVDHPDIRLGVAEAASSKALGMNGFTVQAPLLIVVVREKSTLVARVGGSIKDKDYSMVDVGIAAEHICLQAAAEGLGSCMLGWFNETEVKKLLHIPRSRRVELIITIGYTDKPHRVKRRKEISEVVSYNRYQE